MKVSPLKRYTEPGFPTRRILDEHPELLALVPARWRANPVVITALTGVCLLSMSFRSHAEEGSKTLPLQVAPIFQHGDGRGSFGCMSVSPPVFLSEAEARQVITEEAKKADIVFTPDVKILPSVAVPITDRYAAFYDEEKSKTRSLKQILIMDGVDKNRKIGYEYVSKTDFEAWEDAQGFCTAYDYDILDAATRLDKGLANEKLSVSNHNGVFYDPMVKIPSFEFVRDEFGEINEEATKAARQKAIEKATEDAREQLREQVRDFIKWLKAQEVI